jgi:hypothetical protein
VSSANSIGYFASYLSDTQDAIKASAQFGQLPDGTNHVTSTLINGVRHKHGMSAGNDSEPVYLVLPKRVFGLIEKSFPKTATRWRFDYGFAV